MKKTLLSLALALILCLAMLPAGAFAAVGDKANPVEIPVNKTVSDAQNSHFVNYYIFTVSTPSKVQIELKSYEDGYDFVTLGSYGNGQYQQLYNRYTPHINKELGYSHLLMAPFRLAPGVYYFTLAADENSWDLTVHCEDETNVRAERAPNGSFETASPMGTNADYIGNNSRVGSENGDYFTFTLPAAGTVSYSLGYTNDEERSCLKHVTLYDQDKKALQSLNCGFNDYRGLSSFASTPLRLPAGKYYVKVHEYIGTTWNFEDDYTLRVNFTDESGGGYESEPNGSIAQANPLTLGQTIQGSQNNMEDEDYFRVVLNQDSALKITLACDVADKRTHSVRVFDADGKIVGNRWNVPAQTVAETSTAVLGAGTYYVQVSNYEGIYWTSESYRLTVEALAQQTAPKPEKPGVPSGGAETKAQALKGLGLFQGVSNTDFDLYRAPTRTEALVMFIRLIGEEGEATRVSWQHPFIDVPAWADRYVGYAYQRGYTNGISSIRFGASQTAGANMYLTFMLRALAYTDGYDFQWDNPYYLASSIALLPGDTDIYNFQREDIVLVSWAALTVPMNGGNKALGDLLVMSGAFTQKQLDAAFEMVGGGALSPGEGDYIAGDVKYGTYVCKMDAYTEYVYDARYRPTLTLNRDGTFSFTMNFGEGMVTATGTYTAEEVETFEVIVELKVGSRHQGVNVMPYYTFTADFGPNQIGLTDGGAGITSAESVFEYQS